MLTVIMIYIIFPRVIPVPFQFLRWRHWSCRSGGSSWSFSTISMHHIDEFELRHRGVKRWNCSVSGWTPTMKKTEILGWLFGGLNLDLKTPYNSNRRFPHWTPQFEDWVGLTTASQEKYSSVTRKFSYWSRWEIWEATHDEQRREGKRWVATAAAKE